MTAAFTGPRPNPLAARCSDVLAVPSPDPQVVQKLHLVSVHVLCEYVELALPQLPATEGCFPRPTSFNDGAANA